MRKMILLSFIFVALTNYSQESKILKIKSQKKEAIEKIVHIDEENIYYSVYKHGAVAGTFDNFRIYKVGISNGKQELIKDIVISENFYDKNNYDLVITKNGSIHLFYSELDKNAKKNNLYHQLINGTSKPVLINSFSYKETANRVSGDFYFLLSDDSTKIGVVSEIPEENPFLGVLGTGLKSIELQVFDQDMNESFKTRPTIKINSEGNDLRISKFRIDNEGSVYYLGKLFPDKGDPEFYLIKTFEEETITKRLNLNSSERNLINEEILFDKSNVYLISTYYIKYSANSSGLYASSFSKKDLGEKYQECYPFYKVGGMLENLSVKGKNPEESNAIIKVKEFEAFITDNLLFYQISQLASNSGMTKREIMSLHMSNEGSVPNFSVIERNISLSTPTYRTTSFKANRQGDSLLMFYYGQIEDSKNADKAILSSIVSNSGFADAEVVYNLGSSIKLQAQLDNFYFGENETAFVGFDYNDRMPFILLIMK